MALDVEALRNDFPILARQVHGRPLVYLDSAATSQKPRAVVDALARFYLETNANIHRGAHGLGAEATAAYEGARGTVERFIGANNGNEVVFTRGTTEAVNLFAQSWGRSQLRPGDEIALPVSEHHANFVPWHMVARATGARLVLLPLDGEGRVDLDAARSLISPRCRLLALASVSNVLGAVQPVRELAALAKARGAAVFLDAAQAAPHFPLELKTLGVDAAAFSAHKMLGPTGLGVLWVREDLFETLPPWQGGGGMISRVSAEEVTWTRLPWRFEAGTPPIAQAAAFGAALRYLRALGWDALRAREEALNAYALERLKSVDGLKLFGPPTAAGRVGVFSFLIEGTAADDVGALLDAQGIEVRCGHHCAQPLMAALGVRGLVRASTYLYTLESEIDALVEGLRKAGERLRRPAGAAARP